MSSHKKDVYPMGKSWQNETVNDGPELRQGHCVWLWLRTLLYLANIGCCLSEGVCTSDADRLVHHKYVSQPTMLWRGWQARVLQGAHSPQLPIKLLIQKVGKPGWEGSFHNKSSLNKWCGDSEWQRLYGSSKHLQGSGGLMINHTVQLEDKELTAPWTAAQYTWQQQHH